jgi:Xaa-Pro aminopeptidase
MMQNLKLLQAILREHQVDAWLLYDFRKSNSIAHETLGLPADGHFTRRWAVVIPAQGEPTKIVNAIETHSLASVQAREIAYASRLQWEESLATTLKPFKRIALEYSPMNALPVVAKVDAGTVEWLRTLGLEIVSSADIVQQFTAVWSEEQFEENKVTSHLLRQAMVHAMMFMRDELLAGTVLTEYHVQQQILQFFEEVGIDSYSPPIVAVNANAANPHYDTPREGSALIQRGDVILVDMWAKKAGNPHAVYSDITWMAFAGEHVPERPAHLFRVIAQARDAVVSHLQHYLGKMPVRGCDLDDVCRNIVNQAGYGQYFIHRTGHSIKTGTTHGPGANLDNYETQDTRRILPMTSFSVEPGIYIPGDIGLRTELDVVVSKTFEPLIWSAPLQHEMLPLLADDMFIE